MTVTGGSALGKEEIDRMVKEAESRAEEDRQRRESVELRNEADALAFRTEKILTDHADILTDEMKAEIQEGVNRLKEALKGENNDDEIKTVMEQVNQRAATMGQSIYQAAQAKAQAEAQEQAAAEGEAPTAGDDDVVDAEIVDEDNK